MKKRVGGAIAAGSMWSLFLLSFLAVLREGAETVVFYIGIAPAIPLLSLVAGILGAFALLVIIGFLIIRFSVRLPLHYFFLVATVLIYYLAFKIAGQSIHSLQLVGILPTHIARRASCRHHPGHELDLGDVRPADGDPHRHPRGGGHHGNAAGDEEPEARRRGAGKYPVTSCARCGSFVSRKRR